MLRAAAKVTSKGQVTVPVEVRDALGIQTGDTLVFEVKAGYAVATRQESVREVSDRLAASGPTAAAKYATDDEAVAAFFAGQEDHAGTELLVVRCKS